MKTLVLLIILIALSLWYFDFSRRMTDTSIRESYQVQAEAFARFDALPLCAAMDESYVNTVTLRGSNGIGMTRDKTSACSELTLSLHQLGQLSKRTGGMLAPDFDYEITSITLAPNRKSATVEISSTLRMGRTTLSRTRSVDHLIRRNGQIRSVACDDSTWVYQGE